MQNRFTKSFIGNKEFYSRVIAISLPIVLQNAITNFVDMLDNIMVGKCGTDQMNGVTIVVQIMFVFHLCVWGMSCGAGIFTAQFFGKGDHKGVRDTFRAKIYIVGLITAIGMFLCFFAGDTFVSAFIHSSNDIGDPVATLHYAHTYMNIMIIGMIPSAVAMVYSATLRDIGETALPMKAGIVAVAVNLTLNYLLIFGNCGFPKLGVVGAGIATCVSRIVEIAIIVTWTHSHTEKCKFIVGVYSSLKIPPSLIKNIIIKGLPLGTNETLWSLGLTMLNQSYSLKGLYVVAALNITSTISNLFNVLLFAIGEAISIIVGQLLGAGKNNEAQSTAKKMIFLSTTACIVIGLIMMLCKDLFPAIYNTEEKVKTLASYFILITSLFLPLNACIHGCYFTLRSGGKTFVTFLFDSVFVWIFIVPGAEIMTRFTSLSIELIFLIIKSIDILKCAIGITLVKKGVWIQNIT